MGRGVCLIPYVYVLTYICMYIHYCTTHAAPHPSEYTDIAMYTGLVCLALLPKPQTLFTILGLCYVNKTNLSFQPVYLFAYRSSTIDWLTRTTARTRSYDAIIATLRLEYGGSKFFFLEAVGVTGKTPSFWNTFFNDIIFSTKYKKLIWYRLKTIAKIPYQT